MRITIMQPYFIPYAGYFRLFASSDLFVVYDCVQFTRRGWLHRNQLLNYQKELSWLTLPLVKAPQDILISQLQFAQDAVVRMHEQFSKFPIFQAHQYKQSILADELIRLERTPVVYIVEILKIICHLLGLPFNVRRSSELSLPKELNGQDRILAIARFFQADTYVNASGGTALYQEEDFTKNNIQLKFLPPYQGGYESILSRIVNEDIQKLRDEIISQSLET